MDAEGPDRERALEARIASLEARLERLERLDRATPLPTPTPGMLPAPIAPTQVAPPTPQAPMPWMAAGAAATAGAAPPAAASPTPLSSRWVAPEPMFRMPAGVKLPDLSGSLGDIEERLAGRALALVGGIALVLGTIFFLSLAFTRGWIGPELRVVIGLVAGMALLGGGALFMERKDRLLGHVLTPVGLAMISISLVAATSLYDLIPVEVGLLGALASAITAAVIAVRANAQLVAGFGLVAVLIAPPLMGATPDLTTLLFIAVVLIGTTAVALWRSWTWLPPVAFVLAAPQAASWVSGGPEPVLGLVGITLFWALNLVAAGGEAVRRHRDDLSPSSATLLLANVAFFMWAGFTILSGDLEIYRGAFLVLISLAQTGVGGSFLVRDGERNLFGLLAVGTGIAALTMAAPIQLGAEAVPVAWTAEAVALAWLAVRRGHPYSAFVSAVLYAMAGLYVLSLYSHLGPPATGVAFADAAGAALGFFLAGAAAGVWIVRDRSARSALAAVGLIVAFDAMVQVLVPASMAVGMTVLMVAGTAAWRSLRILPSAPIDWQIEGLIPRTMRDIEWRGLADALLPLATGISLIGATLVATGTVMGPWFSGLFGTPPAPGVPFADIEGAVLAIYLVGLGATAWLSGKTNLREPLAALGILVTTVACAVEFDGVALVAAWAALTVLAFALWRALKTLTDEPPTVLIAGRRPLTTDLALPIVGAIVGGLAALHVLATELPLRSFGQVVPPAVPFTDAGAAAALILIVAALLTGAIVGGALARRTSILIALGIAAYAIPFEVYAWAVVVLWVALTELALVLGDLDRRGRDEYLVAASVLLGSAVLVTLLIVAPPTMLVVGSAGITWASLAQSLVAVAAVSAGWWRLSGSLPVGPVPPGDAHRRRGSGRVSPVDRGRRRVRDAGGWQHGCRRTADPGAGGPERAVGDPGARRLRRGASTAHRRSASRRVGAPRPVHGQGVPLRSRRPRRGLSRDLADRVGSPPARECLGVAAAPARPRLAESRGGRRPAARVGGSGSACPDHGGSVWCDVCCARFARWFQRCGTN